MRRAARLTSRLLVCLLAVTPSAIAQDVAGSSATGAVSARASAEALFEEGVRLSEQKQYEDACRKFEASESLDEAVGTLLRLADCREKTGRYASAWARFREAGSLAETRGMKDRARIAAVRSAALEPKLSRVVLQVPPAPPAGYAVKLGELTVPSGSWGTPLPLDSGTVSVEASAPGYVSYRRYVAIPADAGARVEVVIPPLEPRPPARVRGVVVRSAPPPAEPLPAPPPDTNRGYAARVVGLSLAATGGVGLAAGGVLGVIAKRRHDDARALCPEGRSTCSPRGAELRDESERLATYAAVSAAIGGGFLLAGLVVYFTAPDRERVALGVAPDGRGGLTFRASGSF